MVLFVTLVFAPVAAGEPGPNHPWPIGPGPRYRPTATNPAVLAGRPVGGLHCTSATDRFVVHVELFADRRVVVVPSGIGVARSGCRYPLSTATPTGVVAVSSTRRHTLGDLFRVWGRVLAPSRLLSFHGPVAVFVDGRRFTGRPGNLELRRRAQIVVELGRYVAPHPTYVFPRGSP